MKSTSEEITSLRQQVQELERSAKAWEEDALRYHRDAEFWKAKHLEAQAREAKLRDLIEHVITEFKITYDQYEMCRAAIAEPQDDTALKEYRKQVLLEAADRLDADEWDTAANRLRRMAEE